MQVDDDTATSFQALYQRLYDDSIDLEAAREMARQLLTLYEMLLRPEPDKVKRERL